MRTIYQNRQQPIIQVFEEGPNIGYIKGTVWDSIRGGGNVSNVSTEQFHSHVNNQVRVLAELRQKPICQTRELVEGLEPSYEIDVSTVVSNSVLGRQNNAHNVILNNADNANHAAFDQQLDRVLALIPEQVHSSEWQTDYSKYVTLNGFRPGCIRTWLEEGAAMTVSEREVMLSKVVNSIASYAVQHNGGAFMSDIFAVTGANPEQLMASVVGISSGLLGNAGFKFAAISSVYFLKNPEKLTKFLSQIISRIEKLRSVIVPPSPSSHSSYSSTRFKPTGYARFSFFQTNNSWVAQYFTSTAGRVVRVVVGITLLTSAQILIRYGFELAFMPRVCPDIKEIVTDNSLDALTKVDRITDSITSKHIEEHIRPLELLPWALAEMTRFSNRCADALVSGNYQVNPTDFRDYINSFLKKK